MTNHERDPRHPEPIDGEEDRSEPLPAPDTLDPELLADTLRTLRRYAEASRNKQDPFLIYRELNFPAPAGGNEAMDYLDRYVGYFPDRSSFLRSRLDHLGWSHALEGFISDQGMWPDDLTWDDDVLWEHLSQSHVLVEQYGGVYAFRR